jgi:hypothetical protein
MEDTDDISHDNDGQDDQTANDDLLDLIIVDSPQPDQREHYALVKTEREAFHLPWLFGYLEFE